MELCAVNKTELMAIEYLKQQGVPANEILNVENTPKIVDIKNNEKYESKFLYGNTLVFSQKQINVLDDRVYIIVFDKQGKFITKFRWGDRDNLPFKFVLYEKRAPYIEHPSNGLFLNAELENQLKMYIDSAGTIKPTKGDLVNKSSIIGMKILNITQKHLNEKNVDDALLAAKMAVEEIVMELSKQ